jgi:alanine racemase
MASSVFLSVRCVETQTIVSYQQHYNVQRDRPLTYSNSVRCVERQTTVSYQQHYNVQRDRTLVYTNNVTLYRGTDYWLIVTAFVV